MKKIFEFEWSDGEWLGPEWMNADNLELCLYSSKHTNKELVKVREIKAKEVCADGSPPVDTPLVKR